MQSTGWFFIGIGTGILGLMLTIFIWSYMKRRRDQKFTAFVEELRDGVDDALASGVIPPLLASEKEISELMFRDRHGELCTVKIVIDHGLDRNLTDEDKARIRDMIISGDAGAGTLDDLLHNHVVTEEEVGKVKEFVFSSDAVHKMRMAGMEPDEVVTKMLRASGRII